MVAKIAATAKAVWEYIQGMLDVNGDVIMLAMSSAFIFRVVSAAFGHPGLNASEAAMYASAISAFAYSNKGTPKS